MSNKRKAKRKQSVNVVCILWPIETSFESDAGRPAVLESGVPPSRSIETVRRVERYLIFSTN